MVTIVVEGKTDREFLQDFISKTFDVAKEKYNFKIFDGKDNIFKLSHKYYEEIEKELDTIDKILIAVDADDPKDKCPIRGYEETEQKLKEHIEDLDFNIPVDYFIFSDDEQRGYLESFLLSVLDEEQKACINTFKDCFAYDLSDKWVYNSFYKHNDHPFDFSHSNFDELKQKLQNLFNEGTIDDNTTSN